MCGGWRRVSRSTPFLWTRIVANADYFDRDHLLLLNQALFSSSNLPLTIDLSVENDRTCEDPSDVPPQEWVQELVNVAERWRNVAIHCDPAVLESLFSEVQGRLVCLETLEIDFAYNVYGGEQTRMFSFAPALKRITLIDVAIHPPIVPLAQLVHVHESWGIDEEYNPLPRLQPYLSTCPNLVHLELTKPIGPIGVACPSITHPSIRYLCVSDEECLRSLTLPSLQELHIKSPLLADEIGSILPCPSIILVTIKDLLIRSRCSLKCLTLLDMAEFEWAQDVLELTPDLQELKLTFHHWYARDTDYDGELSDLLRVLPTVIDLVSLEIEIYPVVQSRERTVRFFDWCDEFCSRLKTLKIVFYFDADLWIYGTRIHLQRLRELKASGLDISITTLGGLPPLGRDGQVQVGFTVDSRRPSERIFV